MIAIDTSSLIAYFSDQRGKDVQLVDLAFEQKTGVFPPVVLCELLSDYRISLDSIRLFKQVPLLDVSSGFWERAGENRARILKRGHKARLADALIAQSCLDHQIPLVTRDRDFKVFEKFCGLRLL